MTRLKLSEWKMLCWGIVKREKVKKPYPLNPVKPVRSLCVSRALAVSSGADGILVYSCCILSGTEKQGSSNCSSGFLLILEREWYGVPAVSKMLKERAMLVDCEYHHPFSLSQIYLLIVDWFWPWFLCEIVDGVPDAGRF